jgi:hypothetical protein
VQWSGWEKRGLSYRQRAEALTAMGIPATEGKIEKIVENAEL